MPDSAATSFCICALTSVSAIHNMFATWRSISSLLCFTYGRAGAAPSPLFFLLSLVADDAIIIIKIFSE